MSKPEIKERPILFSGPMVRAILEGRKTQTRRVVKFKQFGPSDTPGYDWNFRGTRRGGRNSGRWQDLRNPQLLDLCPYGKPGDRLWVREAFRTDIRDPLNCVIYTATPECGKYRDTGELVRSSFPDGSLPTREESERAMLPKFWKGRPSIHMPRWASRLTLEVTEVRVERLCDISAEECICEGMHPSGFNVLHPREMYVTEFCELWQSINGPGSWAANPWVWCVSFKRVE